LNLSILSGSPRIEIIDKGNIMTHKNPILDLHPFTDKGVAGNLTVFSYYNPLLYLHKCAYSAVFSNLAPVKVDKIVDFDSFTKLYVGGNLLHLSFTAETQSTLRLSFLLLSVDPG